MEKQRYIIGIDLGTTNCSMAYAPADAPLDITQFLIPQITAAGVEEEQPLLPSFIYFAIQEELTAHHISLKWNQNKAHCVGLFARERGAQLPTQVISSAKSWLCHTGIDRREQFLPLHAEDSDQSKRMSPPEACAELLCHLREAWDYKNPSAPFHEQTILITVPASFDPGACQLVKEAAQMAGYPAEILLLEEPQAAFYAWLHHHQDEWRQQLSVGDTILVVDIGGGTTDFSLIAVDDSDGNLSLKRIAVGAHLLLGGDNLDLALAYLARSQFEEQGHHIDDWQQQSMIHSCRAAKEKLLNHNPPEKVDITIHGRGSRLIGGTLTTTLTRQDVEKIIVDGFMPLVTPKERSINEKRIGIQQIGLPYVQDPRISSQLAKFLSLTGTVDSEVMDHFVIPSAILFNGGTLKAEALRQRLTEQINNWATLLGKPPLKELPDPDYDFAVSRGAVYYGSVRTGNQIRIRGGIGVSYYIGIEDAAPAIPGIPTPLRAVCIAPRGMEEGTEQQLTNQEFILVLGEQASFRFFSHSVPQLNDGTVPTTGSIVRNWKRELLELDAIETTLDKMETDGKTIRVKLRSKITELGQLELWCDAQDGRKWKLEPKLHKEKRE